MLYDPKWQSEVKADPFSLESLIAWLEKQPAAKVYCYTDNGDCLLAQYFTAMGFERVEMLTRIFDHANGTEKLPDFFNDIALDNMASRYATDKDRPDDRTFAGALSRAREALTLR